MCKFIVCVLMAVAGPCLQAQQPPLSSEVRGDDLKKKRAEYNEVVEALEGYRQAQWKRYREASLVAKKAVLSEVRERLTSDLCEKIFPAWYGTEWAFSGMSKVPGEGKVACGYFVSTCLLHSGFKVQRIKMAQQASQKIIITMTGGKKDVSAGKSMPWILERLKRNGDGIYIVGLDQHVGFVTVKGDTVRFVHSNYYQPDNKVVCEEAIGKNPLSDSNYRVFGKLLDDGMLVAWMRGDSFHIK